MTTWESWEGTARAALEESNTSPPVNAFALAKALGFDVEPWSGRGAELDERAIGQLAAADALRLQHAEEAAGVEIGDGLIGEAAQLLGRARPRPSPAR